MFTNTLVSETGWILRKASKESKAPIWNAIERKITGRRANRSEINVGMLAKVTENGQTVIVPGKILGTGSIGHKLTVCSFSISEAAAAKIIQADGSVMNLKDFIKKYPDGRGVRIIG
jgi:large subunit ribosomal protein L18e